MDQVISGIPAMSENRVLDALEHDQNHYIFGPMTSKSRRITVEEITDEYLKKDWTQDSIDNGVILTETWSTPGKNNYTWRNVQVSPSFSLVISFSLARFGKQVWGFAMVNGEMRYVTRITFTSPEKIDGPIHARFLYDYRKFSTLNPLSFARSEPCIVGAI